MLPKVLLKILEYELLNFLLRVHAIPTYAVNCLYDTIIESSQVAVPDRNQTRIKDIKNVTSCRDSRSAKSIETR